MNGSLSDAPLSGILVVAIDQAVAAPYCTSRLADAGARVIKVERPGGDFARHYDTVAGVADHVLELGRRMRHRQRHGDTAGPPDAALRGGVGEQYAGDRHG